MRCLPQGSRRQLPDQPQSLPRLLGRDGNTPSPRTRAIGSTFQFTFILPKPANSGNTRLKNRKAVKSRHKTHADSANCETAANAAGPRLAEKQRREPTQHTPQKTANVRRNSISITTAANEPCPASCPARTA